MHRPVPDGACPESHPESVEGRSRRNFSVSAGDIHSPSGSDCLRHIRVEQVRRCGRIHRLTSMRTSGISVGLPSQSELAVDKMAQMWYPIPRSLQDS